MGQEKAGSRNKLEAPLPAQRLTKRIESNGKSLMHKQSFCLGSEKAQERDSGDGSQQCECNQCHFKVGQMANVMCYIHTHIHTYVCVCVCVCVCILEKESMQAGKAAEGEKERILSRLHTQGET